MKTSWISGSPVAALHYFPVSTPTRIVAPFGRVLANSECRTWQVANELREKHGPAVLVERLCAKAKKSGAKSQFGSGSN